MKSDSIYIIIYLRIYIYIYYMIRDMHIDYLAAERGVQGEKDSQGEEGKHCHVQTKPKGSPRDISIYIM